MLTSQNLHPEFKLNGLEYSSAEEVLNFADDLIREGDEYEISVARFLEKWLDFTDTVEIKTSGSTGYPKVITLSKLHMINSAKATGSYFKTGNGTRALLCLSADYIAGKMMLVRAMVLGWDLHIVAPSKNSLTEYDNDYDFVAMVPYQVWHSLPALNKVKKLIVGSGAVSKELEEKLTDYEVEAFATYGMTETCTHVAVRRLNGPARSDRYTALPEVRFSTDDRGCLVIDAPKITDSSITTNDMVDLHSQSSFTWLGRFDNVINSGGIKLYAEQIELKLAPHIPVPFFVASQPDDQLGEKLVLLFEGNESMVPNLAEIFENLEKTERPKKVYSVSRFPYTDTGKLKRHVVLELLNKYK